MRGLTECLDRPHGRLSSIATRPCKSERLIVCMANLHVQCFNSGELTNIRLVVGDITKLSCGVISVVRVDKAMRENGEGNPD